MRPRILASIAVALLILGALALRGAIEPEASRARLEAVLGAAIGAPVRMTGAPDVRLLPVPRIVWRDAAVSDAATGAVAIRAEAIEVAIALGPLLHGTVEPAGFTLRGAEASLRAGAVTAVLARLADLPATDVRLENGRLDLAVDDGRTERLAAVDGRIVRSDGGLAVDLEARWKAEPVSVDAFVPLAASESRWRLAASAAGAAVKASGRLRDGRSGLDGTLSLSLPEPSRLARLVTDGPSGDLLRVPVTLSSDLAATPEALTLTDLRLSLGHSAATGSLALAIASPGPALSGTLAFDGLDLSAEPIFGDGWGALPLDRRLSGLSLDLRMSAKRLIASRFELLRVAASLNLAAGRLNAELGEATLWGRRISALMVGDLGDGGLVARLRAIAKDLPAAEIGRLFVVEGVEDGTIGAIFEGQVGCATLAACAGAVEGRLRLSAADLVVTGSSPFGDVTRFHPIVVAPKPSSRKSTWPEAVADLHLTGTTARVDAVEMRGNDARFVLKGSGDLSNGGLDLVGHAYFRNLRAVPVDAASQEIRIPLRVHGTVRKLAIDPAMPEQVPIEPPAAPLTPVPIVPPIAVPAR